VIDLRGNIGGLGGMTMGMASEFSDKETSLGVMTTKGSELKFFVSENFDPVKVPVAVLVDECSISSAEIFSGGLQDLGLAKIFGTRTAGLALPSMIEKLPNGDGFQYAFADYQSASGKSLEKDGVEPDEEISLSRELLTADPDPVLSRALEWIHQQQP
jgi:carboxyl-terminal processing protease